MSQCLDEVRARVQEIVMRLFSDIPNLRIAIIAHGDYCDAEMYGYVTKFVDFTTNQNDLCEFVRDVSGTGGGDFEECYELVLQQARQSLSWTAGTHRSLVMIGDAIPHPVSASQKIDWKEEADKLHKEMGVRVYGVQCMNEHGAGDFFSDLSLRTDGRHLKLDNFSTIIDIIMAICYREHMPEYLEAYEREVRQREGRGIRHELTQVFDALRNPELLSPLEDPTDRMLSPSTGGNSIGNEVNTTAKKARKGSVKKRTKRCRIGSKIATHRSTNVPTKTPKVKTKSTRSTQKKNLSQSKVKFRESVSHSRFIMNSEKWSRWENVLSPINMETELETKTWTQRTTKGGHIVYQKDHLFSRRTQLNTVYEIGVQPKQRKKIYVTYVRGTVGFPSRYAGYWQRYLLGRKHIAQQIDECLQAGCRIFVRRCSVASGKECAKELRKKYDYAWNKLRKSLHRTVIKHGITISDRNW